MKKQIYIIISVALVILSVALLVWLIPGQKASDKAEAVESASLAQTNEGKPTIISTNLTEEQIKEKIEESRARRKFVTLDENKLRAGILNKQMFKLSNAEIVSTHNPMPLSEEQKNDGRIFLSNDLYTLEGKQVGDRIEFTVPGYGLKREAVIQNIQIDPKDDIMSWSGYLDGGDINSENFYITQTVKDHFTVGSINSNGKSYSLLFKNGYGWVNDDANEAEALLTAEMNDTH